MRNVQNIDSWQNVADWFQTTYAEKAQEGNARVLVYDSHVNKPTRYSELFSLGGMETDYQAEPEQAFEDFLNEMRFHLRAFPKKFTVTIGMPAGGAPKRLKITVVEPEAENNFTTGVPPVSNVNGLQGMQVTAATFFENYKQRLELEQKERQIEEILNAKKESRFDRVLDNIADAFSSPELVQGLMSAITGLIMQKTAPPAPVSVASQGFASAQSITENQAEISFRSKFADYGETIKSRLMGNETLVFNVMDNLVNILQSPEKVNLLINYVNELNSVDGRYEKPGQ